MMPTHTPLYAHVTRVCRTLCGVLPVAILLSLMPYRAAAQEVKDSDRLGMALEYFKSGKHHEALLLFERLDKQYKLNPRFHAYMGLCYYKEWEYDKAVNMFGKALPQLGGLAPHELSVYYHALGESLFNLERYSEAATAYEKVTTLCHDNEKADCLYRIGLCHMQQRDWANAADCFTSALAYYKKFLDTQEYNARMRQLENMISGCQKHLQ